MAHYLITGHTGFKGSWLSLLLKSRGHEVSGLALEPAPDSLFTRADIASDMGHDLRVDIRDRKATVDAFKQIAPDYVIHLAAQALVREGYRNPVETYETNVNGTMHVLEASDRTDSVKAQLIVTTDKVYRDDGHSRPYVESDPLGGKDPYSASKAMADILSQEWLGSGRSKPGAIARAGNVIGAGDSSRERLIPDIIRARESRQALSLRYPNAVRPWQHVFDCLNGYLILVERIVLSGVHGTWNFGPETESYATVANVVDIASLLLETKIETNILTDDLGFVEAEFLSLDTTKASTLLGWSSRLGLEASVHLALNPFTAERGFTVREQALEQILNFEAI